VSTGLTDQQRRLLLDLAYGSIEGIVFGQPPIRPEPLEWPDASGVFVTIKRRGALRGCLGTLRMRGSLDHEVIRCARDSATEDPRFPPVSADELPELSVEVSVLGPLEAIEPRPDAFTIGIHGLVVEDAAHRGLLLPQVAHEWGWTPEQFLRQTCIKAGLAPDAWQCGACVYRFAAEVFGD
jgi:AmmeMemoRadiSam system protein A